MNHQEKIQQERLVWIKRLSDLDNSGISVTQYAKTHGLSVHQVYYWKNKLNKVHVPTPVASSQSPATAKNLVKVEVEKKEISKIPDPKWLATFLKALHEVS